MRIAFSIVCLSLWACPVAAATFQFQLLPVTGEVRLRNVSTSTVPFVFYSVKSLGGALNDATSAWRSISNNYDAIGNGAVDPHSRWIRFSAAPTELAEGVLLGPGGALAAQQSISLGNIWKSGATPFPDLGFAVIQLNGEPVDVDIDYLIDGDFDSNGIVDGIDYVLWRNSLGTPVDPHTEADGNGNGLIDPADYSVWRANYGAVLRPDGGVNFGGAIAAALAAPEPGSLTLLTIALLTAAAALRRPARLG